MSAASPDESSPPASQAVAWDVLGPYITGWILQILITGACFQKAIDLYPHRHLLTKPMRAVLFSVVLLNTLDLITTIADLLLHSADQRRDYDSIVEWQIPDCYLPILAGTIALIVQCFFADRAWKICNKNIPFLVLIAVCITASYTGALGLGVILLLNTSGLTGWRLILTFIELWTWSTVVTDVIISVVIIAGLVSKRTGQDMPTDSLVMRIVYTAFQSASITTVFAVSTAILYITQWNNPYGFAVTVFIFALPSLYTYSVLWCLACTVKVRQQHKFNTERGLRSFRTPPATSTAATLWGDSASKFDFSDVVVEGTNVDSAHTRLDSGDTTIGMVSDDGKEVDDV